MSKNRQQVVIGIDLGYECTKVAIAFPGPKGGYHKPKPIFWKDSNPVYALATMVTYTDAGRKVSIGAKGGKERGGEVYRWFKLDALSSEHRRDMIKSETDDSSKRADHLLDDFLSGLLLLIRDAFEEMRASPEVRVYSNCWDNAPIDFVFSIPSTVGTEGAKILVDIAKQCNFESNKNHQVVDIAITEAEAAGAIIVHERIDKLKKGTTALVLDVGGGTSDLAMMTIASNDKWKLDTNFLEPVSCERVGGAHIDRAMGEKILQCLQQFQKSYGKDLDAKELASKILQSAEYYYAKVGLETLTWELPGLKKHDDVTEEDPSSRIRIGSHGLVVDGAVFTDLLSGQIFGPAANSGIVGQAITMRDDLFVRSPSQSGVYRRTHGRDSPRNDKPDQLDYVFFTGGVGGSRLVQEKVEEALKDNHFGDNLNLQHTTSNTTFVGPIAQELGHTQLSVCRGLAYYHSQEILREKGGGKFMFGTRFQSLFGRK